MVCGIPICASVCENVLIWFVIGYDDYQIYLLLSCAPVQGHVAGIVDIPNACTTMGLPIDIFDFDIRPGVKVEKRDLGSCAFASK